MTDTLYGAQQPDPKASRAVLIGVHDFAHMPDLPAVHNNIFDLKRVLTDPQLWGIPEGNCTLLPQPATVRDVLQAIRQAAREATDALLLYYAGHGLIGHSDDELWLSLPDTEEGHIETVVPYDWIAHELRECKAVRKVVLLDCCFSGRAVTGTMGPEELANWALVRGTFVMTSSAAHKISTAPTGATHTAFTGALLQVLKEGIPGAPPLLDMMTIFREVNSRLKANGLPSPEQGNRGLGGSITLFRNRAYTRPSQITALASSDQTAGSTAEEDFPEKVATALQEWQVEDPTAGWAWRDEAFRWGPFWAPVIIVEGDGANIIREEDVHIIVSHQSIKLPPEIQAWRQEIEEEQRARRERGEDYFWNGNRYAIDNIVISRHPVTEAPIITIRVKNSDYYSFLAAQQLEREFADGTTPRSRYLDPNDPLDVPAFMSSSFGTNIAVVTADNKIIFSRRGRAVGSHPGFWNSSANEALSRDIDSQARNAPNIYDVARRGVREELALEKSEYDLAMLGLTVDRRNQWGALFIAELHTLTGDEFRARRSRGVADKFEHAEHQLIPFNPQDVVSFIYDRERRNLWAPTAPALFYLSLVNRYGRTIVEYESNLAFLKLKEKEKNK